MDDVQMFLEYLREMKGPCTDFCLKCPAQGDLKQFYDMVNNLYQENQKLVDENSRLVRLTQDLVDKVKHCDDILREIADKTYIFRRPRE